VLIGLVFAQFKWRNCRRGSGAAPDPRTARTIAVTTPVFPGSRRRPRPRADRLL